MAPITMVTINSTSVNPLDDGNDGMIDIFMVRCASAPLDPVESLTRHNDMLVGRVRRGGLSVRGLGDEILGIHVSALPGLHQQRHSRAVELNSVGIELAINGE